MKRYALPIVVLLLSLMALSPARATNLDVLFQPISQTGVPGDVLNYSAIFTNNTTTDLWISGATFNIPDDDFTNSGSFGVFNGDGNPSNSGAFKLLGNQTLTIDNVVSLILDPGIPQKTYSIDALFSGRDYADVGNSGVFDRDLGDGGLQVSVATPVPEVPFCQMGVLLVLGGIGLLRHQKRT